MSKFVIAIGGTGMRCLESFVHLCAIGMFDNEEINILTLDTDQTNGNKGRVEGLIELYQRVKSDSSKNDGGNPNANTFFSAKLNLYKFYTDYNNPARRTYQSLSQLNSGDEETKEDNRELSDLFLDKNSVQQFNLDHGYRAQTHLGSMLMYHGIIEAAKHVATDINKAKEEEKRLDEFITKLSQDGQNALVFVFGSVFGGTGASSIPIIPVALRDAISIRSNGTSSLDLSKVKFGATLLTEYFTFKAPDNNQKSKEHVIADANNFALNSQAALQFYQADPTVIACYKKLYHIGWPMPSKKLTDGEDKETITGGADQKNDCHVVELLCACAAYDFFTYSDLNNQKASYVYRSAVYEGECFNFNAEDFAGLNGEMFLNKLGAFLSFAHIALSINKAALAKDKGVKSFLKRFDEQGIHQYDSITDDQANEIDEYLKMFAYDFNESQIKRGWIYQINRSIGSGKFIFKSNAFTENRNELEKIDPGNIFEDDKHNWDKGPRLSGRRDPYDNYISTLVNERCKPKDEQHANTTKEKFLAYIYNSITIAQKFNK
jgi:hypothetical protein